MRKSNNNLQKTLFAEPPSNCNLCDRLEKFRKINKKTWPTWHNGPVPSYGSIKAPLLIVGLAPGLRGANRTGRPFTGDFAGDLLYKTLFKYNFSNNLYNKHPDDGLELFQCRISNGVRCLPPNNKPISEEINNCRSFLVKEISIMDNLKIILALGGIAHLTVVKSLERKPSDFKFAHGAMHCVKPNLILANSYHCSRYNTNTGRLNTDMFENVFQNIRNYIQL